MTIMDDRRRLLDQIDRCIHEGHRLTKWEENFLYTVRDKADIYQSLSPREVEILDGIERDKVQ